MNKGLFRMIVFIVLLLSVACGNREFKSIWQDSEIIIDGDSEDWSSFPTQFVEEIKTVYSVVNTDSSLIVMLRFNDARFARMLERRGLTLWFDETCDEAKTLGIQYVNKLTNGGFGMNRQRNVDTYQEEEIKPKGSFSIVDKDGSDEISVDLVKNVYAAADYQDGLFCFEYSLPLSSNIDELYTLTISEKKEIKLGFEISAISDEMREKMKERMGGSGRGRGGNRGMRPGGGRRGGGMAGGSRGGGMNMRDFEAKELWFAILIADSK